MSELNKHLEKHEELHFNGALFKKCNVSFSHYDELKKIAIEQQKEIDFLKEKLRELTDFYGEKENYTKLLDYKGLHYVTNIGSELTDQGDLARKIKKEVFGDN